MSKGVLREIEIEPGLQGLELSEGKAKVHLKKDQGVFYNPVQCFNRDLSAAVINEHLRQRSNLILDKNKSAWDPKATILEALAASGLRSIRYALELDDDLVREIVANDISKSAVESIQKNSILNEVDHKIKANLGDAVLYMHQCRAEKKYFDVVDLDPYGCAAKFLDPAVQVVQNGGLLCVTATDMAILCGNTPETCRAKYGSMSLRGKFCHEMALRILLCSIETAANRHGRFIEPLLSISVDFYIRVFVRISTSPLKVKLSTAKLAMVYSCVSCENVYFQRMGELDKKNICKNPRGPPVETKCDNCGSTFQMGGPIYMDPIHNQEFVQSLQNSLKEGNKLEVDVLPDFEESHQKITSEDGNSEKISIGGGNNNIIVEIPSKYQTLRRMQGIVMMVLEELHDIPLHFTQEKLSKALKVDVIPMVKLRSAILNAGYRVSLSHTNRTSVKTDAPQTVIWDIMRKWVELGKDTKKRDGAALKILEHQITTPVDFTVRPDAIAPSMKDKSLRFQLNPERNWGPKARATASDDVEEKRRRLQGKKKKKRQENNAKTDEKLESSVDEQLSKKLKSSISSTEST